MGVSLAGTDVEHAASTGCSPHVVFSFSDWRQSTQGILYSIFRVGINPVSFMKLARERFTTLLCRSPNRFAVMQSILSHRGKRYSLRLSRFSRQSFTAYFPRFAKSQLKTSQTDSCLKASNSAFTDHDVCVAQSAEIQSFYQTDRRWRGTDVLFLVYHFWWRH